MSRVEPYGVLLVVALWALVGFGLWALRQRSPLHMPTIALVVTGLVGSFYPLASTQIQPSSWRNLDLLSPSVVLATQLQYVAFAAGLLGALLLAANLRWNDAALAIHWPIAEPSLSDKDAKAPFLADIPEARLPAYSA